MNELNPMEKTVRILLAEDSPTQALHTKYMLRKAGFDVLHAPDGAEALKAARANPPDLVISDVLMPEMTGYELCKALKSDEKLRHIPVILLTTLSNPTDVFQGLECEADAFLTKPAEEATLISRVQYSIVNARLRRGTSAGVGIELFFAGRKHYITSDRIQIIDLLLSSFETAVYKNKELEQRNVELKKALRTIKELEANYRAVLESNDDAMVVTDRGGVCRYANPATEPILGSVASDLVDKPFEFFSNGSKERGEVRISHVGGAQTIAQMYRVETVWRGMPAYLFTLRDVTEAVRMREELKELSLVDELTGLYNRRGFVTLATQQLKVAERTRRGLTLLFADMDGLKTINDGQGHQVGDQALQRLATILGSTFRQSDIVGRFGGDEFVVLAVETDLVATDEMISRTQAQVDAWNERNRDKYSLSLSIGRATFDPENPCTLENLMEVADKRMYEIKKHKKGSR